MGDIINVDGINYTNKIRVVMLKAIVANQNNRLKAAEDVIEKLEREPFRYAERVLGNSLRERIGVLQGLLEELRIENCSLRNELKEARNVRPGGLYDTCWWK